MFDLSVAKGGYGDTVPDFGLKVKLTDSGSTYRFRQFGTES